MTTPHGRQDVSPTQSITAICNAVKLGISCIAYLRGLCDADSFQDCGVQGVAGLGTMKTLTARSEAGRRLIDWIESGIFDALHRRYLREAVLCVYSEGMASLLESYAFAFAYGDDGSVGFSFPAGGNSAGLAGLAGGGLSQAGPATPSSQTSFSVAGLRVAIGELTRDVVLAAQSLPPLPRRYVVTMRFHYYEAVTPPDYNPPSFQPPSEAMRRRIEREEQLPSAVDAAAPGVEAATGVAGDAAAAGSGRFDRRLGTLRSRFHSLSVRVRAPGGGMMNLRREDSHAPFGTLSMANERLSFSPGQPGVAHTPVPHPSFSGDPSARDDASCGSGSDATFATGDFCPSAPGQRPPQRVRALLRRAGGVGPPLTEAHVVYLALFVAAMAAPNGRVTAASLDTLAGLGRRAMRDALDRLAEERIVQRCASGSASRDGADTDSSVADSFVVCHNVYTMTMLHRALQTAALTSRIGVDGLLGEAAVVVETYFSAASSQAVSVVGGSGKGAPSGGTPNLPPAAMPGVGGRGDAAGSVGTEHPKDHGSSRKRGRATVGD